IDWCDLWIGLWIEPALFRVVKSVRCSCRCRAWECESDALDYGAQFWFMFGILLFLYALILARWLYRWCVKRLPSSPALAPSPLLPIGRVPMDARSPAISHDNSDTVDRKHEPLLPTIDIDVVVSASSSVPPTAVIDRAG